MQPKNKRREGSALLPSLSQAQAPSSRSPNSSLPSLLLLTPPPPPDRLLRFRRLGVNPLPIPIRRKGSDSLYSFSLLCPKSTTLNWNPPSLSLYSSQPTHFLSELALPRPQFHRRHMAGVFQSRCCSKSATLPESVSFFLPVRIIDAASSPKTYLFARKSPSLSLTVVRRWIPGRRRQSSEVTSSPRAFDGFVSAVAAGFMSLTHWIGNRRRHVAISLSHRRTVVDVFRLARCQTHDAPLPPPISRP